MKGLDEAVFRNIEACKEITKITRSSYGPNGNFMLIKIFLISIKSLISYHPKFPLRLSFVTERMYFI